MSFTLWFTGLSGAGKTILSRKVFFELRERGLKGEHLDGDIIRANFSQELGFSQRDRDINVRRIGFVSHLLNKHGVISVVAVIAPYAAARRQNRQLIENYVEVFVHCPLSVAESRDVKGLYAKARAGVIPNFTGVSDPYEEPVEPDLEVRTDLNSVDECYAQIIDHLESRGLVPRKPDCRPCLTVAEEERAWREHLASLGYAILK